MIKYKFVKFIAGLLLFLLVITMASFSGTDPGSLGKAKVPDKISRWRPIMQEYCDKYKCSDQVDLLLALMYQEIGNTDTLDVMQSSESMGLAPNAIQDPIQSIEAGVKHFKNVLDYGNSKGVDFSTIVQSYNFGSGYIDYVSSKGGKHTKELAISFSSNEATAKGWNSYGDVDYVVHVMSKVEGHAEGVDSTNVALKETDFSQLIQIGTKYEGQPYVFGGDSPDTGFDCSGIIQYEANNKTEALVNTQKIKDNISQFVDAEYNYTNKNYTGRFEIIKKYVTDDVYNALKGPGDITTPTTSFQNEVKNLDVYITTHDNKTIKALVNITTLYSIGGIANKPINQIYELELQEQGNDQWIITNYTLMGNFAPYSTNQ